MFYFETNGKIVKKNKMPYNTYSLEESGLLVVHVPEGLVPLKNINGDQYNFKEMAGKTFDGDKWYKE